MTELVKAIEKQAYRSIHKDIMPMFDRHSELI